MVSGDALTVAVRDDPDNDTLLVVAAGEIDLQTVALLRHRLLGAIEETRAGAVVLDATAVDFLSSAGLPVLITATREAHKRNRCFQLVTGSQRSIMHALHVAGLDRVVPAYLTYAEALAARPEDAAPLV